VVVTIKKAFFFFVLAMLWGLEYGGEGEEEEKGGGDGVAGEGGEEGVEVLFIRLPSPGCHSLGWHGL